MFVVRKLDRELTFVFCFRRLLRTVGFAERETTILAWRGAHVTDDADRRAGGRECLPCEKLLAMTTYTSIMVWKVRNVGKDALRGPFGRDFVTGVTRQALVLFR